MLKWQSEQVPYPLDADYIGDNTCIFELESAAEQIIGKLNAGGVFMYLFRRFGYPRFGWDGKKQLVLYRITTPMPGVILLVEPDVTGAFTFGYTLREDISKAYAAEDRKPYQERYERFEAWAIKMKCVETMHIYYEPDLEKLNRVWRTWAAANKDNDFESQNDAEQTFYNEQANITQDLLKEYLKIEPHAKSLPLMDRPDDSIMKQCHVALCDSLKDLLRPVYVRDVMFNIRGFIGWKELVNDDDAVKCAAVSGCGVGDEFDEIVVK